MTTSHSYNLGSADFAGYACAYSTLGKGTIFLPGAFEDALPEYVKRRGAIYADHAHLKGMVADNAPLGHVLWGNESSHGLWIACSFLSYAHREHEEVYRRLSRAEPVGMSVGVVTAPSGVWTRTDGVQLITRVERIIEVSVALKAPAAIPFSEIVACRKPGRGSEEIAYMRRPLYGNMHTSTSTSTATSGNYNNGK